MKTINNVKLSRPGSEDDSGTLYQLVKIVEKIKPGYLADFVLLSSPPKEVADFIIQDIAVAETWSCGKRVFVKPDF